LLEDHVVDSSGRLAWRRSKRYRRNEQAFPQVAFGYHDHGIDLTYDRSAEVDLVIGDAAKAKKMLVRGSRGRVLRDGTMHLTPERTA
jgi:hypothetical protein